MNCPVPSTITAKVQLNLILKIIHTAVKREWKRDKCLEWKSYLNSPRFTYKHMLWVEKRKLLMKIPLFSIYQFWLIPVTLHDSSYIIYITYIRFCLNHFQIEQQNWKYSSNAQSVRHKNPVRSDWLQYLHNRYEI